MKIVEKRFTKKKSNNIIRKNYNPLNEELLKSYEREGLFMEEILSIVKKLSEKYNKNEALLLKMIEISNKIGYNIKSSEGLIEEFYLQEEN